jgi:hypothetical protein
VRRGVQAGTAVLLAGLVADLGRHRLPFDGERPPLGLGIAGSNHPTAVAYALWQTVLAHHALLAESLVCGLAAALLSSVRRRGPWPAALFAAGPRPHDAARAGGPVLPFVAAAWLTAAALALEPTN